MAFCLMMNGSSKKVGTSMGKDWAPHYAGNYMDKSEKEALLKRP